MKFSPKAPDEGVNRPEEGLGRAITGLALGALVVITVFFAFVSVVVDFVVDRLDPATEVELFGDQVPTLLEAVQGPGFDDAASQALAPIFERVAAAGPELPYTFDVRVSCMEVPNALALPGGGIVVTAGLLEIVESEEELAFILGHELGHFVHRDHLRGMGRSLALQLLMGGMFLTTGIDPTIGLQMAMEVLSSAHSREQEIAADELGLKVLAAISPHDVSGGERALHALHDAIGESALDTLDFTRSHPLGPKRLEALRQHARSQGLPMTKAPGTPLPLALKQACQGDERP